MIIISKKKLQNIIDEMVKNTLMKYKDVDENSMPEVAELVLIKLFIDDKIILRREYEQGIEDIVKMFMPLYAKVHHLDNKPFIIFHQSVSCLAVYIDEKHVYTMPINISTFRNNNESNEHAWTMTGNAKLLNALSINANQYLLTLMHGEHYEYNAASMENKYFKDTYLFDISGSISKLSYVATSYIGRDEFVDAENNTIILSNNIDNTDISII